MWGVCVWACVCLYVCGPVEGWLPQEGVWVDADRQRSEGRCLLLLCALCGDRL